ncbi:MAG: HigA family addiction module antitoxin [Nitrosomonadaceae bacterium]|jgi:HTH-type transcriptional regulator/antitoxin HigA|nr:HigA family addiction module antitoxin [Nitrosomonadaceae bacterium]
MMNDMPAEVFPPGDYIREELEAREWSQTDLAEIMGRTSRMVSEIISGKRAITPETARRLGDAFGTSAQLWLNLESAYQLSKLQEGSDLVSRRAKLYAKAPIKEMVRRHWIEPTENIEVLESQVLKFFNVNSVDDPFEVGQMAARKSSAYGSHTPAQAAWYWRARRLAEAAPAERFSQEKLKKALTELRNLAANEQDIRFVPRVLAKVGVRFLLLEALQGTKIDGACIWLDESRPAVVVSMRHDRIDAFWFTLMHEVAHVMNLDGLQGHLEIDTNLVDARKEDRDKLPEIEVRANTFAANFLIPEGEITSFINRTRPLYYRHKIEGFANRVGVHPGIVNGQLRFRDPGFGWDKNHVFHVKVRHIVVPECLTDGWDHTPPTFLS